MGTTTANTGLLVLSDGTNSALVANHTAGSQVQAGTTVTGITGIGNGGAAVSFSSGGTLINLGGMARDRGTYDTVNVNPGGQFVSNPVSGQGASAVSSAPSFWQLVDQPAAHLFVGPLPATTPATVNVSKITLNREGYVSFNRQSTQGAQESATT